MTRITINIEDGAATVGYVPPGAGTAVSNTEATLQPTLAIMQGNLFKKHNKYWTK